MRLSTLPFVLVLTLVASSVLVAQYRVSGVALRKVPTLALPGQDNAALLAAERAQRRPGRADHFAVSLPTKVRPTSHGIWRQEGQQRVWRLRVTSPGARTLNLGFAEFDLPPGGELYLLTPAATKGPFTPADHDIHDQLWTPILEGDELMIELRVPLSAKRPPRLYLTAVNHDFAGVTSALLSGSCNLDVVCGAANGWPIVDRFRDPIRSVAAYTLNGRAICSGFLVNNANQDGTPYFMTADHCNVTDNSAPSLVAYWNYENAECRQPDSGSSGQNGNGSRAIFNSGASLVATYPVTDFTLAILDDPIPASAGAYYAGWSAAAAVPTDTVACIHHPQVEEKRISFSFRSLFRTFGRDGGAPAAAGDHLEVPGWDIGTTEGGSSGAPLFDRFGRVRGQLFGGEAACDNDAYDVFGFFHASWTGGGTPQSRLSDWLDPCGTGVLTLDGLDATDLARRLQAEQRCRQACTGANTAFSFTLGTAFPAGTPLRLTDVSPGFPVSLSAATAAGGETVTLTTGSAGLAEGQYFATVVAGTTGSPLTDSLTFSLTVGATGAAQPRALRPAAAATGVSTLTDLAWTESPGALTYDFQLSTDSDFSTLRASGSQLNTATATLPTALDPATTYYWRLRSTGDCGPGEWNVFSFTTSNEACATFRATTTPIIIPEDGTPVRRASLTAAGAISPDHLTVHLRVTHSYVGDLEADLRGPDGTTIRLFDAISSGGCFEPNLDVSFTMAATRTAGDFTASCNAGGLAASGEFQPATSFAVFAGRPIGGEWELILYDRADGDGGAIEEFSIDFCGTGMTQDLAISAPVTALNYCTNRDTTLQLSLGADYTGELNLRVEADEQLLDNYTFSFNPSDRLLTVNFSSWSLLEPGRYNLSFTVITVDNQERKLTLPLTVNAFSEAGLNSPDDGGTVLSGPVLFDWLPALGATDYTFEYSLSEDFATIAYTETTDATSLTLDDLPLGMPLYWRVLTNGGCGSIASAVRTFTIRPVGTQDFGDGRSVIIYPNPARAQLTVEARGSWPAGLMATLIDAAGRRVSTHVLQPDRNSLAIGHLAAGVYYLRLRSGGAQRTERVVVLP